MTHDVEQVLSEQVPLVQRLRSWVTAGLQDGGMARIPWRILEQMAEQAEEEARRE